jgi:pyruvate/2-oxoglutarate dehydrogenase complex dihydrolipoamide acyltransferase (E2) component
MADVLLPKLGMQTVDVDVTRVCVAVGDIVSVGDALFEVQSEKADVVIEAEEAGVVAAVFVAEGDTVVPGAVLAQIGDG